MDLEVGTIKTTPETRKKVKRRGNLNSGNSGSGGKNDGGGGGGGNDGGDNFNQPSFEPDNLQNEAAKSRIVMWFLLLVVLMTFGGLISAYVVIATNGVQEWTPFNLPIQVYISTALILFSSFTYHIANKKLHANHQVQAKKWFLATTVLGAMFIASQILAWFELVRRGLYVSSNPYAGFFYILTAVHAFHVLGGIAALGYIVLRTWHKTENELELAHRQTFSKVISWYWHFMDGLWIVLIFLLGFWK
jgi:cytochrome c oxidase subunit 3